MFIIIKHNNPTVYYHIPMILIYEHACRIIKPLQAKPAFTELT